MSSKRTSLENYVLLLQHVEKMRFTTFKPKAFLKSIRPFCKTENIKDKLLYVRIRGSKTGICIQVNPDFFLITQSFMVHEFIFYCDTKQTTSKHLLNKLLKHNLLSA